MFAEADYHLGACRPAPPLVPSPALCYASHVGEAYRTDAQDRSRSMPADAASVRTEILRYVGAGIVLVRASDALIVFTNPSFEAMFGYGPGELLGRHVSVLNAPGEIGPRGVAEDIITRLRASGRWEGELRNRRKDGTSFWNHASVSTFDHVELGAVWISIHRDISERKRLEQDLLRAKSFLDSIVENIPDMVFVKDARDLSFVLFNRAGEDLLGYGRADLIGKNDYDFFPKAEADFFTEKDRAVLRDKARLEIAEEPIDTAAHGRRLLHTKKIPILDEKGEPAYLLGISEDVTERRRAERVRRRRARATAAVNTILRGLHTHLDVTAAFPEVCAGLRDLAQCSSASLAYVDEPREWIQFVANDAPWPSSVSRDVRLRVTEYPGVAELLAGRSHEVRDLASIVHVPIGYYLHAIGFRSILNLPLCAGREVIGFLILLWRDANGCATVDRGALGHAISALAIAMQRHRLFEQVRVGREQLTGLSRRLLTLQETERRHLARELHDEIGQHLTGIGLLLGQIAHQPQDVRARLGDLGRLVTDLIDRVRDLSLDLRPAMLDDFGLVPALRWLFERYRRQTNVRVEFDQVGMERRFPPDVETAVYRIVQEALTNVARYANVEEVAVHASAIDCRLRVAIEDHGAGFDVEAELASATTSGLSGMRERAALLGGRLSIESRPGAGTCIRAEFESP
ncbi:MAG: PAS domain S-box protein [Deltaproteobacteria bacterium]|nr:PAS domain S-box protein [Deltaproteobacteria bacterium]